MQRENQRWIFEFKINQWNLWEKKFFNFDENNSHIESELFAPKQKLDLFLLAFFCGECLISCR